MIRSGWGLGALAVAFLLLTGVICGAEGGGVWPALTGFVSGFLAALWLMRLSMSLGVSIEEWRPTDRPGRGRATGVR